MNTNSPDALSSNDAKPPADEFKLLPETETVVRRLAEASGVHLATVEDTARRDVRAAQGGSRTEAERKLDFARQRKMAQEATLEEAKARLHTTEPKVILKGHRAKVGLMGWFVLLLLLGGLLLVLWNENGAAAQALLSTGAFDVDSIQRARMLMLTPIAVGIAFVLGFKLLPPYVRRRAIPIVGAALAATFLVWAICFAIQAEGYRTDAAQEIRLSQQEGDDASAQTNATNASHGGSSAWLMFGCLAVIMCLTTFMGHTGVESYMGRYEAWVPNPEHMRALEVVQAYQSEIHKLEKVIIQAERAFDAYVAYEEQAATQARALYLSLKQISGGLLLVFATVLLTGCASTSPHVTPPAAGGHSTAYAWANQPHHRHGPVTRVLALSPVLGAREKAIARQQLESEIQWLVNEAPVGSVTVVVDALNCVPIARLDAVQGVPRIRRKALTKQALTITDFLNKPHPRMKDDGRIHLPRLAQTAKQWRLPSGSHVVVLGCPLFIHDGKDKFFSMAEGRVPSDGCLFEDPKLNIYSIVGREKALSGQFWHLGWADDGVFEDDTHRQAVLRFWHLYFQGQSAQLVTAQPSFEAALEAARSGTTEPFMYADVDRDAGTAMVRIVKVQKETESETSAKAREGAERRAAAERAAQQAAAAKAAEEERVRASALREKEQAERRAAAERAAQQAATAKAAEEEQARANALREKEEAERRAAAERIALQTAAAVKAAEEERARVHALREKEEAERRAAADRLAQQAAEAAKAAEEERARANALREMEREKELTQLKAQQPAVDIHGNLKGSDKDLIADGQMKGQTILMVDFQVDRDVENSPLARALNEKGFTVEQVRHPLPSLAVFEALLAKSQQLWLWSSGAIDRLPPEHLHSIIERWKQGKLALCLLADNTPFTAEAGKVLAAIVPGSTIMGNYIGQQKLHSRDRGIGGFDSACPLFHNISVLYEGTTISSVSGPGLEPVCFASNGLPLVATLERPGSSRLVVHGGYTSFYERFWDDAGVSRFAVNCAGWLGKPTADADRATGK